MDTDEGLYHAKPQTRGKIAHETVDNKTASNRKDDLLSLPVYSGQYKLMGKVDVYRKREKLFIDRAVRTAFNRKQFWLLVMISVIPSCVPVSRKC